MARIDRARLEAAQFPLVIEIATRWADVDMQGHINNVAAMEILQEARVKLNFTTGLMQLLGDLRSMVAALNVEYAAEMRYPEPVFVHTGILSIGRSSFTIGQVARQNGRSAIYAEAVMVIAGPEGAVPIPDGLRAAYQRLSLG